MGLFATRSRIGAAARPEAGESLPVPEPWGIPAGFEAVGEALASGRGSVEACVVVGEALARDGAPLDEGLEGLLLTAQAVTGADPSFSDVRALSMAWSEVTLGYLHEVSCEEPLTGLASLAHVRSRLSELRRAMAREGELLRDTHALVVVSIGGPPLRDRWARALRMSELGELARTVFDGGEVIGRLAVHSLVVVARRDERLGRRVTLVRMMASELVPAARVWIEGLPVTDESTGALLDELTRP